jgi:hypothetical protein
MTPLATHVSAFLRERLPLERRASERTCDTYALALRLFFEFAARQLKVRPSALGLEQLDASMVLDFLEHWKPSEPTVPLPAMFAWLRYALLCGSSSTGSHLPSSRSNAFERFP